MTEVQIAEVFAVVLALAYVLMAVKEQRGCWIAAVLSAGLYLWIFVDASLYMEAALQVFYIALAGYGFWIWGAKSHDSELPIARWPLRKHLAMIAGVLVVSILFGAGLSQFTHAAMPWIDSFTTVAAVATTWLVTRKILENWLYWIVIDAVSVYLYLSRGLELTAVLFAGYTILALAGYLTWHRHWLSQLAHDSNVNPANTSPTA